MTKFYSLTLIALLLAPGFEMNAQPVGEMNTTHYGLEMNYFATNSGFKPGTELYFSVIPDNRKLISLGIYFSPDEKKLSGFTIQHERSLYQVHGDHLPLIMPFAFYNLIYRKTTTREIMVKKDVLGEMATYTSLEHHIGLGARIRIGSGFYLKTEAGLGLYLGSIRRPSEPDILTGEIYGTNGFGGIVKVGIGYYF